MAATPLTTIPVRIESPNHELIWEGDVAAADMPRQDGTRNMTRWTNGSGNYFGIFQPGEYRNGLVVFVGDTRHNASE